MLKRYLSGSCDLHRGRLGETAMQFELRKNKKIGDGTRFKGNFLTSTYAVAKGNGVYDVQS